MQGFLGPDRHSASPACTHQALRAPAHTQAAPIPKRKLASCGSWFCLRKQIPSTLYSEISLSHTYNRSQSPRVVPSQAGQSQLFHNFWIFPHSRCLAVSLVLMLFHLAPVCSFIHPFTQQMLLERLPWVRPYARPRGGTQAKPKGVPALKEHLVQKRRDTEQTKAQTHHTKSTKRHEGKEPNARARKR